MEIVYLFYFDCIRCLKTNRPMRQFLFLSFFAPLCCVKAAVGFFMPPFESLRAVSAHQKTLLLAAKNGGYGEDPEVKQCLYHGYALAGDTGIGIKGNQMDVLTGAARRNPIITVQPT
jgi:hypothetical protein